jgi:hypothetical protein
VFVEACDREAFEGLEGGSVSCIGLSFEDRCVGVFDHVVCALRDRLWWEFVFGAEFVIGGVGIFVG